MNNVRAAQQPLRQKYVNDPGAAMVLDRARTTHSDPNDPFHSIVEPMPGCGVSAPVGVHQALGGPHDAPTPGDILCARLHGMLHRQREVNRLQREITVARRSHGGLGDQVAKMHDELELAAQAQRELLPDKLPRRHGISLAALWRPAQYVSGDVYDVIQLDEDHIGLFLADAVANFECKLESELETGDHFLLVGRVVASHVNEAHRIGVIE